MLKKVPDVFVIVFSLIILAAVLTWVLPGGSYERAEQVVNGQSRTIVVDGSYHREAAQPQTWQIFTAPVKGFLRSGITEIVVFIFLVG
ncbi:MAG: YfcC family protein, partial [Thermoanaerobaculales bacterium]